MAQRLEVAANFIKDGFSVQKVLKYASIASSTWYNQKKRVKTDQRSNNKGRPIPGYSINSDGLIIFDQLIIDALIGYRSRKEFANGGGCHKLSMYLKRDYNYTVNHKKVYRLCKENGLLLPKLKKKKRSRSKRCMRRVITRPHQMWELDLKYGFIHGENRFFFILAVIDVYMRVIVNYYIGLKCAGKDLVFTIENAIEKHGILDNDQLIIRSDNGSQMTSNVFMEYIESFTEDKILHELIPPATPNKNAHIEAFNSILEIEFFQPRYFKTYGQAYQETIEFMEFYNCRRIHGSIKPKAPMEVYNQYKNGLELNIPPVKV